MDSNPFRDRTAIRMRPGLLFESLVEVLSAVEDAEDGHYFGFDLESDTAAAPETEDAQAGTDVVSLRSSHGEGLQAFACFTMASV